MKYLTSLRPKVSRRLEEIDKADLLVGIPCFNGQGTIEHVIRTVSDGLAQFYPDKRSLIMISDGGSTDDTREVAEGVEVSPYIEKLVQIYRGYPGKGSGLRSIFEAATFLGADACAVVDSDLRSIRPDWVKSLIDPVLNGGFHFVAPLYKRYKYDGTITNNIVYNLTRALFGKRIRQPIGGDFGFSSNLARYYANEGDWESDIARFGVDIWMTVSAITQNLPVCQAYLGTKVHDPKDPGASLGPMFRQVVFTLFQLMDQYYSHWSEIGASEEVTTFGETTTVIPEGFPVDINRMITNFREGFEHFGVFWKQVVSKENFAKLEELYKADDDSFFLHTETWAKLVYDFSATFHAWERHRKQLVDTMSPLYYARVASFVKKAQDMNDQEAEQLVEDQAQQFESLKPYLLEKWKSIPNRKD